MEILKLLVRVMIFLLSISCSGKGWIIASIPVTPQDTAINTVFIEIVDADSTVHWYHGKIYDHSNWCYAHNAWEEVEVK